MNETPKHASPRAAAGSRLLPRFGADSTELFAEAAVRAIDAYNAGTVEEVETISTTDSISSGGPN